MPPSKVPETLDNPLFEGVEPAVVARLGRQGVTKRYAPGERLLREDERELRFFVLQKGSVRVYYRSPKGFEVLVKLFHAPAAFGEMECLNDLPYLENVDAVERCSVLEVPRAAFLEAVASSHRFARNLLVDVSARLCIAAQNERALAFLSVETRLANLLWTYAEAYGLPAPGGTLIRVPLSQERLADALGVNRRSVTRALKRWVEEGLLLKRGGHFLVCDLERLAAAADSSVASLSYRLGDQPLPRALKGRRGAK